MTKFATEQAAAARDSAERPAVRLDDVTLTYGALDQGVAREAGLLRAHGVEAGDRVSMQLPNIPYLLIVYAAVLRRPNCCVVRSCVADGLQCLAAIRSFG
jgi:long-chain acyl-CoA synthetase